MDFDYDFPDELQELQVPVISKDQCGNERGDIILCAGGREGEDSCVGDSGGPLTYESSGQHVLIGAVSFGDVPCGLKDKPAFYVRISSFRTWIEDKMVSPEYCGDGPDADS